MSNSIIYFFQNEEKELVIIIKSRLRSKISPGGKNVELNSTVLGTLHSFFPWMICSPQRKRSQYRPCYIKSLCSKVSAVSRNIFNEKKEYIFFLSLVSLQSTAKQIWAIRFPKMDALSKSGSKDKMYSNWIYNVSPYLSNYNSMQFVITTPPYL